MSEQEPSSDLEKAEEKLEEAREEAVREAPSVRETAMIAIEHDRIHAVAVYEIIQREGSGELARGTPALWWSGVAAGLAIGFSVLAEALFAAYLPDEPWKPLVENFGYCVGFLIVIMARQQLFTENTLTAVLPVIVHRKLGWFLALMRLWFIVLTANVIGCFLFALFFAFSGTLSADVQAEMIGIGKHLMELDAGQMFLRGIVAGWLVAALVWMLPSAEGSEFIVITLMTYLIALGDFTHIVAGSAEVLYLLLLGETDLMAAVFRFFLPVLTGNIVGGTVLFAVTAYAQVREEIDLIHQAAAAERD